jgi:excisionase family DNA binding protein
VITQLWTVEEAAERLRVSRTSVYGFISSGELRVSDMGTPKRPRIRVRDEDLGDFIEKRSRKAS